MDTRNSEIAKDCNDPFFHSSSNKPSIIQSDIINTTDLCNCDFNITQGVCEHVMCDNDDDDDDEETNNNMYLPDELDMLTEELDSNEKDYKCRGSMSDSHTTNGQGVEGCNLSTVFQGDWPMDRMYWNEDGNATIASSMEGDLHPDTSSMMSFDSSMTASSIVNQTPDSSDRSHAKADVVYTLLSMLHTHDKMEVSEMLLTMSKSKENCVAMIESGCLPLLVQLLHDRVEKQTFMAYRQSIELRKRAAQILHNIVFSQPDDKKGRREARVLRLLEQVREYSDDLKGSQYEINDNDKTQCSDQQLAPAVAALMKLSFDEEHRHAMCLLGGLQAIAELVEIDQEVHGCANDQYCIMIRRYSGMALTNLTFGDGTNKTLLCSMDQFMHALVAQLHSPSEDLRQVTASVLRNLSWRADSESKSILQKVGAVTTLMKVAMEATKESTLKSILSALWNLSAHCSENKADICAIDGALGFLVGTLTYKSGCKNLAVVENGGGILRNVSSHIALQSDHRVTLRKHNCLQILLHHLKSPSLTVVSNACCTLWNLSARNAQDQRTLWEMGAVGMLKKLINSKHKMISMGSSAALKNLLSAMPPGLDPSMGLSISDYNSGMVSLHVRKQQMLYAELDQNLSETYDNTDSPKSSPTYKKKPASRRAQSAPVYRQGIPTRIGSKTQTSPDSQNVENQRQGSPSHLPQAQDQTDAGRTNIPSMGGNSIKKIEARRSSSEIRTARSISPKKSRHRVGSPSNLRPQSYPAQMQLKPNVKQISPSFYNSGAARDRHEIESTQHAKMSVGDNSFPKFGHKIKNLKYEELECQEQPVDYSLQYSEEITPYTGNSEKTSSESKIPLPKINNYVDQSCRPSAIVSPMFVKNVNPKQRGIPRMTPPRNQPIANTFSHYTETDLDEIDQVVDYSQRYDERHNLDDRRLRDGHFRSNSLPREQDSSVHASTLAGNCEDTVKVYCTEDTPVNFSSASSLTDLCDIDSLSSHPRPRHFSSPRSPLYKTDKDLGYARNAAVNNKISPCDKAGKVAKSGEDQTYVETPLMFSRCSSLGSLSSFDQPSVHDDRSSVSDFSRLASGVVSPSDLPDSPSQTMPTSPNRKQPNAFSFEKKEDSHRVGQLPTNVDVRLESGAFDEVRNTYVVEGTPCTFSTASSLSSLTIESEEGRVKASLVKKPPVTEQSPLCKSSNNIPPKTGKASVELPDGQKVVPVMPARCQSAKAANEQKRDISSNALLSNKCPTRNIPYSSQTSGNYNFDEDTIKVYNTEGTPNLSHSASYSDLSMLSFCAEKNTCEPSLEVSYAESNGSYEDDAKLIAGWHEKKFMQIANSSEGCFGNASVSEEDEIIMRCIQAGMPKPSMPIAPVHATKEPHDSQAKNVHIHNVVKSVPETSTKHVMQHETSNVSSVLHPTEKLVPTFKDRRAEDNSICEKEKSSTKAFYAEESRPSQLVEGTPVSFSCNSSLSSLSIESGDEPDFNIWKQRDYAVSQSKATANLHTNPASSVSESTQGGNNHSSDKMFLNSGKSTLRTPGHNTQVTQLVQQNECSQPKNKITEQSHLNTTTTHEITRNTLKPQNFEEPHQLDNVFMTGRSMLERIECTDNQRFYVKDAHDKSYVDVRKNSQNVKDDFAINQKNVTTVLKGSKVGASAMKNVSQAASMALDRSNIDETALSDYEEAMIQKCILAGMPNPKNVASAKQTSSNVANNPRNVQHQASTKEKVVDEQVLSEYEEALLQNCISAGMPKHTTDVTVTQVKIDRITNKPKNMQQYVTKCADNNSISETELSEYEEELLQKCILAGMPKPKSKGSSKVANIAEVNNTPKNAQRKCSLPKGDVAEETALANYEEELLQKCILAGMPKPKNMEPTKKTSNDKTRDSEPKHLTSPKANIDEASLSEYEEALLHSCILAGMPKSMPLDTRANQVNRNAASNKLKSMPANECSNDKNNASVKLFENEKQVFKESIPADMPKSIPSDHLAKVCNNGEVNKEQGNSQQYSLNDSQLSDYEEALLQQCILAGMPKPRATGATAKTSNSLHANNKQRETVENTLLSSTDNQCSKSGMNVLQVTHQNVDKTMHKELFDEQLSSKKCESKHNSPMKRSSVKPQPETTQHVGKKTYPSQEDNSVLKKCISANMPKQSNVASAPKPTVNTHSISESDKVASKVLFDQHIASDETRFQKSRQAHELCSRANNDLPDKETLSQNDVKIPMSKPNNVDLSHINQLQKSEDELSQKPKTDSYDRKNQNTNATTTNNDARQHVKSDSKLVETTIHGSSEANVLSHEDGEAFIEKCIPSGMQKQHSELLKQPMNVTNDVEVAVSEKDSDLTSCSINNVPNISVKETIDDVKEMTEHHDLALEAQRITDDMLDVVIDGVDDMTVSTLSCMSEIENVTPPSVMAELGCLSLTNSTCDEIKPLKANKVGTLQKKTLLKELQLSRLSSDSDLPGRKNQLSDSTLSLSNSTDILENINPPTGLDISLTASIGSLDSLQSDIFDSKADDRVHPYNAGENSMNERFCEAAAMVEMYAKEFSNITGVKNSNCHNFYSSNGACVNMNADAFEDNTEPACDTIASDIEFVDELPCDEDDLGSETLLAPQLSSLNKEEPGDGSIENLTLTLTEEPPVDNETEDCLISDDALRENADLILSSLKKVHISESSDFGGLMSNEMIEDETLSLISNESDEDSLSPDGVFNDGHALIKTNGSSTRSNKKSPDNISPHSKSIAKVLPTCKNPKGLGKFGFGKSQTVSSMNTQMISPNTESCYSEASASSSATVREKQPAENFINTGTFTRRKSSNSNIPNISSQQGSDTNIYVRSLKSPTCSSRESIESCSTSNSVSSLSSCGDASSSKSSGKKKTISSKIGSIWKSSNKSRSKSSINSDKGKTENAAYHQQEASQSDCERSLSPALQRSQSQSSSPLTLSRSSTDEKINVHQDSGSSFRRPTTLMLFRRNESPKLNARQTGSSSAASDKQPTRSLVTSPTTQSGKSSLPVRKSMIPMSSKIGSGDPRTKTEPSGTDGKQKPCIVTMV